jgi:hypothetical protein
MPLYIETPTIRVMRVATTTPSHCSDRRDRRFRVAFAPCVAAPRDQ